MEPPGHTGLVPPIAPMQQSNGDHEPLQGSDLAAAGQDAGACAAKVPPSPRHKTSPRFFSPRFRPEPLSTAVGAADVPRTEDLVHDSLHGGLRPFSWDSSAKSTRQSVTTSSTDSRVHVEGLHPHFAQSPATRMLKAGEVEWWVVRPATEDDRFPVISREPSILGSSASLGSSCSFTDTWAGLWPSDPSGPRTTKCQRGLFGPLRRFADGRRNRYRHDGFDLDLTYVTTRIVAMGFPAVGVEAFYRNPRQEVKRFLRWAHQDHYRVYNLCGEASHADNGFGDKSIRFPCIDHAPPELSLMMDFCRDAQAWLNKSPENVAVVHCKAGKGRTGTMICALLVFSGAVKSAYEALRLFETARGGKRSGVTIPDQIRWVAKLERFLRRGEKSLLCSPIGFKCSGRHRLRYVRLGPLDAAGMTLRVGLAVREDAAEGRSTYVFEQEACEDDMDSDMVKLDFEASKIVPDWTAPEGVLKIWIPVHDAGASGGCSKMPSLCRHKQKQFRRIEVWWHYAFLLKHGDVLALEVTKAFVGGLQRDMEKHRIVPEDFRVVAVFDSLTAPKPIDHSDKPNGAASRPKLEELDKDPSARCLSQVEMLQRLQQQQKQHRSTDLCILPAPPTRFPSKPRRPGVGSAELGDAVVPSESPGFQRDLGDCDEEIASPDSHGSTRSVSEECERGSVAGSVVAHRAPARILAAPPGGLAEMELPGMELPESRARKKEQQAMCTACLPTVFYV